MPETKQEGRGELTPEQEKKIKFFVASMPQLDDSTFHAFVQGMGVDPHEAEEVVYRYVNELTNHSAPVGAGLKPLSAEDKKTPARQVALGTRVEKEHTDDPAVAKHIVKQHGGEIKDYYDQPGMKSLMRAEKDSPSGTFGPKDKPEAKDSRSGTKSSQAADPNDLMALYQKPVGFFRSALTGARQGAVAGAAIEGLFGGLIGGASGATKAYYELKQLKGERVGLDQLLWALGQVGRGMAVGTGAGALHGAAIGAPVGAAVRPVVQAIGNKKTKG